MEKRRNLFLYPPQSLTWLKWMRGILFVVQKKACWIWIAVDRLGKRFLSVVVGSRATETGQCVWEDGASSQHSARYD